MSIVVVPCNVPLPLLRVNATFRLAGKPLVELFPKLSWLRITGWVVKTEPAVAPDGWVVNDRVVAPAGLIATTVEVVFERLPLLNRIVMLVATGCDKLL